MKKYGVIVLSYDNSLYRSFDKIRVDMLKKENIPFSIVYNGISTETKLKDWEINYQDPRMNPAMYNKFVVAAALMLQTERWKDVDYILRINSSTFLNFKKINQVLEQLPPEKCFAGRPLGDICLSGLYTFFSKDVMRRLIEHGLVAETTLNDDVVLGHVIHKLGIQRTLIKDYLTDFFQLTDVPRDDEINNALEYTFVRVKNEYKRDEIDPQIWKLLHKSYIKKYENMSV